MKDLNVLALRLLASLFYVTILCTTAVAAEYKIDSAQTFVEFRIKHLGYSWLYGRFNTMEGEFSYDAKDPEASTLSIDIDPESIDTNHAERDKHLREEDFLNVNEFAGSTFKSSGYTGDADSGVLSGMLTLHGVTKPIDINITKLGEGADPWGGYRAGFEGKTTITLSDFGIDYDLGPASKTLELELGVEGIRQ